MARTSTFIFRLACGLAAFVAAGQPVRAAGEAHVTNCRVMLIRDVPVPAQEAGVLVGLEVKEGMNVESGKLLGQVDDSQVQMKKKVAVAEYEVAKAKAESDINIRFNQAASEVAHKEYLANELANKTAQKAKPQVEMDRLLLQWRKAYLSIEQATLEHKTDGLTADAKNVEVEAADNDIQRRKITAPFTGEVVEIFIHAGEWVNPGTAVLRLAEMDKLRVEGFLNIKDYAPGQVSGRPAKLSARVGPDRTEEFQGKVVFVSPLVEAGEYRVWAEVVNRRDHGDGEWLLRPGMEPEMRIDVAGPRSAAAPRHENPSSR